MKMNLSNYQTLCVHDEKPVMLFTSQKNLCVIVQIFDVEMTNWWFDSWCLKFRLKQDSFEESEIFIFIRTVYLLQRETLLCWNVRYHRLWPILFVLRLGSMKRERNYYQAKIMVRNESQHFVVVAVKPSTKRLCIFIIRKHWRQSISFPLYFWNCSASPRRLHFSCYISAFTHREGSKVDPTKIEHIGRTIEWIFFWFSSSKTNLKINLLLVSRFVWVDLNIFSLSRSIPSPCFISRIRVLCVFV